MTISVWRFNTRLWTALLHVQHIKNAFLPDGTIPEKEVCCPTKKRCVLTELSPRRLAVESIGAPAHTHTNRMKSDYTVVMHAHKIHVLTGILHVHLPEEISEIAEKGHPWCTYVLGTDELIPKPVRPARYNSLLILQAPV